MSTSARMLRLLSMLQTHRYWAGAELSDRLEVSPRTLRRDIERLRELGYVVDAVRGVAGGYQLRAGGSLPPLLLEDEEAVAVAVALHQAAHGSAPGLEEIAVQALSKVSQLMPARLRRRMDALRSQTDATAAGAGPAVDPLVLTTLAQACRDDEPLHVDHRRRGAEEPQERWVEPHRLVTVGRRWYLVAYDRDRQDWRSFRVDRISAARTTGQRFRPREVPGGDALGFVHAGLRDVPHPVAVRLVVAAPVADLRARWGRWCTVGGTDGAATVEMSVDDLTWPLLVVAELAGADDVDVTVEHPPELAAALARLATRFAAPAGSPRM